MRRRVTDRFRSSPLVPLALSVLVASLGTSSANVLLPTLTATFETSFSAAQWVVLAYLLAMTALLVIAGRLGDLFGRRGLLLLGVWMSGAASIVCALAPDLWILAVARAVHGAGAALLIAMAFALAGDAVADDRRGFAMGVLGVMSSVGTMLGPAAGGAVLAGVGWRVVFLLPLPVIAAVLWSVRHGLAADERPHRRNPLDWLGALLLGATLMAYAVAVTPGRAAVGRGYGFNLVLLAAASVGFGSFLFWQTRAASPLVRLALFRDRVLATGMLTSALVSTVMMATLVTSPFYLSLALGLTPGQLGLMLAIGPLVSVLAGVPAGRLADRFGPQRVAVTGLAVLTAGTAWLSLANPASGGWGYALPIVLLSAGYAGFQSPNSAAVMARAAAEERGAVSGLLNLARNLGLLTGASLMGAVFAVGAGTPSGNFAAASPRDVAFGMHACFQVGAAMGLVALVISGLAMRSLSRPLASP